ncbi:CAP domain-containing protein [Saccharothrix sp. Mg75]|uniref:CAP domain-containing protein n=1 Tax=Saccharothrix sp. Mg75 TaxID=3445357 RepID=UPI003EED93F7
MSRKSRVLPLLAVVAGLGLTGCEHPDGLALVAASASVGVSAAPRTDGFAQPTTPTPSATSVPASDAAPTTTTTTETATSTTGQPPTTTRPTTTRPPAPRPEAPAPAPEPAAPVRTEVEPAEAKVVELTNAERAANGCPALTADDRLGRAARAHSADMAARNYFSHTSLDGRSFVDRVKAAGHPGPGAENIAAGQRTAEAVVKGWMESPGHRANILNCELKTLGAGMARGGSYGTYWTQNFGW